MSSIVCQELQSCLEVKLIESRSLRLKLAPPKTDFEPGPMPSSEEKDAFIRSNNTTDIDTCGWSLLQSFGNTNDSKQNDKVYVHPLLKRSTITLSEKSLRMCTESLGSESGSEISQTDDISLFSLESAVYSPSKPRESVAKRKKTSIVSFPPPLTSISVSNGLQVKSHREGGRLVLQAVAIPPCNSYFHAERSQGRLKLSIYKDATAINRDDEEEDREEEEEEEEEEAVENDNENGKKGEVKEESVMIREVRIGKEILRMLGVKLRQRIWTGQADAKKVWVLCTKACLIGTHCWWVDYFKPKTWKISLNPRVNYYNWMP